MTYYMFLGSTISCLKAFRKTAPENQVLWVEVKKNSRKITKDRMRG